MRVAGMGVYALRGYVLGLQSGKAALRFLWARARRQPAPPASAEMYVLSQAWQVRRDRIPGMTRVSERSFCEWYTRHRHPAGAIVELGPWLGALTRARARGLRARGLVDRVESYDLFVWQPYMDQLVAGTPFEAIATGDDFRQQFLAALGHLGEHVNARRADLAVEGWDGGPISLLVIDAMKGVARDGEYRPPVPPGRPDRWAGDAPGLRAPLVPVDSADHLPPARAARRVQGRA
jgi:hypothetical protein